ncbi:hypothetical protein ACFSHQ_01885 [Gemmobacter lanyuensis]
MRRPGRPRRANDLNPERNNLFHRNNSALPRFEPGGRALKHGPFNIRRIVMHSIIYLVGLVVVVLALLSFLGIR